MKLKICLAIPVMAFFFHAVPSGAQSSLLEGFRNPPRDSRPQVWWHWMNGNISKEGIRKDIEWMDRAGIGGFHNFDAGLDTPQVVDKRLVFMTPEWKDAFNYAVGLAESHDMEVSIASSPGWSATGGPWVRKEDSMKTLNWRELTVSGGRRFRGRLPEGNNICGKYLTHHLFYDRNRGNDFYRDIAVIAVKIPDNDLSLDEMGAVISASGDADLSILTDRDINERCIIGPDDSGFAWVQFTFPRPQTIKSLFLARLDDGGLQNDVAFECSDDGVNFRGLSAAFPESRVPFQVLDTPPASARHFRLRKTTAGSPLDYTELELYAVTKVDMATEKAGFFCSSAMRNFHPTPDSDDAVRACDVIDITDRFKDGILDWKVPAGRWKIYRFGYNLRGRFNNPASPEATGLEVDKFDADAVRRYYRDYIDLYREAIGDRLGKVLTHIMIDSFEAGCQTWTGKMAEEFRARRGYDLIPWLPALAGQIIGSSAETERFLDDWRLTQSELYKEKHYQSIDGLMAEYGLERYTESLERSRPCVMDGIDIESTGEIPMAAFWIQDGYTFPLNYEADLREAASTAHIYGKELVAAESFTAHGDRTGPTGKNAWAFYPANLKPAADAAMASGLTRFVVHCSPHQPVDDKIPGLSLGVYGQWFHRHETWAEEARPWTDYLARSTWMLRQGTFAADIAYYYGETVNLTCRFEEDRPFIPAGYSYDFVNRTALLEDLAIDGKELVAPSGVRYKALMLDDDIEYMSVAVLRRVKEIADAGIIVAGTEPGERYGRDGGDAEFSNLVASIWHSGRRNVCSFAMLGRTLAQDGTMPQLSFANPGMKDIRFVHRHLDGGELFWIANIEPAAAAVEFSFDTACCAPVVLHADTGVIEKPVYRVEDGRTVLTLELGRDDAQFVVFSKEFDSCPASPSRKDILDKKELSGPWEVKFQQGRGAPDSITMDSLYTLESSPVPGVKYFSGTASYHTVFMVEKLSGVVLDLGGVFNLARVFVNGQDMGQVWKEPFRIDISDAIRVGENSLEVEVTNSWVNRMIGDAQPGVTEPFTYVTVHHYDADSPLRASGLAGPVVLELTE